MRIPGGRGRDQGLCRTEKGSLTIESLLVLPVCLLALLLVLGLIRTSQAALAADLALDETAALLAKQAYVMEQMLQPAEESQGAGPRQTLVMLTAQKAFEQALREKQGILQSFDGERLRGIASLEVRLDFAAGKLELTLSFPPAGLGGYLALLPRHWLLRFQRSRLLWLTGRNLLPDRGLEKSFAGIKKGPVVYITRWGVCYHQKECRYLAKSSIPADLSRLSKAYRACSIRRPPGRQGA